MALSAPHRRQNPRKIQGCTARQPQSQPTTGKRPAGLAAQSVSKRHKQKVQPLLSPPSAEVEPPSQLPLPGRNGPIPNGRCSAAPASPH